MKFFVAGARGMLASDLIPLLEKRGPVMTGDLPDLDITDHKQAQEVIEAAAPDVIINCAAYTAVDRAESEKEAAFRVNGEGAGNLAVAARSVDALFVHISTDFVFDGKLSRPYREEDQTSPLSIYGASKLDGEGRVREATDRHIIVRTSWLYGRHGNNFVKTISRLASEREDLGVVFDQAGTPTYTVDLAAAIINLVEENARGTFHFSNEGVTSWYDFAYEIMGKLRERGAPMRLKTLRPITTAEYPTPAVRPAYSVLDKGHYKKTTGTAVPHWSDGLDRYFREI